MRFDELRAGNKARSGGKAKGGAGAGGVGVGAGVNGGVSPKAKIALVKKEQRDFSVGGGGGSLVRRSSVSSSSSVHSGSGASDWDDNGGLTKTASPSPAHES